MEIKREMQKYENIINEINNHLKKTIPQKQDYNTTKWNGKLYKDGTNLSLLDIDENKNITWNPYQIITWSFDAGKKNELQIIQSAFEYWQKGFENIDSNKTLPILLFKQIEPNDKTANIYIEILNTFDTDTKSKESSIPTIDKKNKKVVIKIWSKNVYSKEKSYENYLKRKIGYTLGLKDINKNIDHVKFKSVFSQKNNNKEGEFDYEILNAVYPIPQLYIEQINKKIIEWAKNTDVNKLKRNYLHYMAILLSENSFTNYISLLLINNINETIVNNFNSKDRYGLTPIQYSFSKIKILNGEENINLRKYPQLYLEHKKLKLLIREQNEFNNKNFIDLSLYNTKNIDSKINLLNTRLDYSVLTFTNIFTQENQPSIKYIETTYSDFYKPSEKLISIDEKIDVKQINKFIIDTRNNYYLKEIQKIEIKNVPLNDEIIQFINFQLESLNKLILINCNIDDNILKKITNINKVKFLDLRDNKITKLNEKIKDFFNYQKKKGGNFLDLRGNSINIPKNKNYFTNLPGPNAGILFFLDSKGQEEERTKMKTFWNKVLFTPQKSMDVVLKSATRGPLDSAKAFVDLDRDRILDENEPSAITAVILAVQTRGDKDKKIGLNDILKTLLDTPTIAKISQCLEYEVKTLEQYKTNNKNRNLFHLLIIYKHKFDEKIKDFDDKLINSLPSISSNIALTTAINEKDIYGMTPLHYLFAFDYYKIAEGFVNKYGEKIINSNTMFEYKYKIKNNLDNDLKTRKKKIDTTLDKTKKDIDTIKKNIDTFLNTSIDIFNEIDNVEKKIIPVGV